MLTLPSIVIRLLNPFAPVFNGATTWEKAKILVIGAILGPRKRTVTSALRAMGLSEEGKFAQYHQVLNRAVWSSLAASRVLLSLILKVFVAEDEPLVVGLDDTIERRWGKKIAARVKNEIGCPEIIGEECPLNPGERVPTRRLELASAYRHHSCGGAELRIRATSSRRGLERDSALPR